MTLGLDKSTWKRVTLGDVAAASKEKVDPTDGTVSRYIAGEHMDSDDLKIRRWGDPDEVDLGPAFHRRFRPGQVLYGSRRTYLRKVAVADFDGVCANTTFVVQARDEAVLDQAFLPFIMSSEPFHAFAISESKGSVNPYVNWSDIERFEFDLPPIDEQKRIADLLWAVERHRATIADVPGDISRGYDTWLEERLADIPSAPLGEVLQLQHGRPVPSSLYGKGQFPLLRPGDMKPDGSTDWSSSSVCVPREFADQYPAWILRRGDLVINMTAQTLDDRFLGRVCLMHDSALLNQRIGRLVGDERVSTGYVFTALHSARFAEWVARRSEGSKVKHMHWRHIANYPMPLPSVADQAAIVAEASLWDTGRRSLTAETAALSELRSSLLADIFGGN